MRNKDRKHRQIIYAGAYLRLLLWAGLTHQRRCHMTSGNSGNAISDELTVDNGLLLRCQPFVIPHSLQHYYIRQLHQGHLGLEATKRRAREIMFWPSIYQDIEHEISTCAPCNALRPHQTKEPLQLHDIPDLPWALTAAKVFDWGGGGGGHLVLMYLYSGWFEIDQLPNII